MQPGHHPEMLGTERVQVRVSLDGHGSDQAIRNVQP